MYPIVIYITLIYIGSCNILNEETQALYANPKHISNRIL